MTEKNMAQARHIVDALVRSRRSGVATTAALGGLALLAGLAYRSLRGGGTAKTDAGPATPFDHIDVGEDEARTMLRAMIAATLADGIVDADERKRLNDAVAAAGVESDGRAWLERELAEPFDVDDIAEQVTDPDTAARIYAAARLAIDPDTLQEREFLKALADALDVPGEAAERLEAELTA
jgi:uncharacterized membrane protein YebE (DUF533 family)